jgi:serine/threonine protein kinase
VVGTHVSHYRIISRIGAGGMGTVYLAEDTHLKRQVALKFLAVMRERHVAAT